MQRLRDATSDEHYQAEHHPFQQAMLNGDLSRQDYVDWLGQMYLIHGALEGALRRAVGENEGLSAVVVEHQYQLPYLRRDLEFFAVEPEAIEPLPATERFMALVGRNQDDPMWLLGLHYVLEGSNNGSRFLARRVARAHDLAPGQGLRYLDPYGDSQRDNWMEFKRAMDALELSGPDRDRLVEAARQMYRTVSELADDLTASR